MLLETYLDPKPKKMPPGSWFISLADFIISRTVCLLKLLDPSI